MSKKSFALVGILSLLFISSLSAQDKLPKISVEEIVSKHLASIGTNEAINSAKSRIFVGNCDLSSKVGYAGKLSGATQLASSGNKSIFAVIFDSPEYPYEKVAFDGKSQSIGRPNGQRTIFNDFISGRSFMTKDGLFNGVLSSNWLLLDLKAKKIKLSYAGTGTFQGRPVYKLAYPATDGGETNVTLFFDGENFRHLGTTYQYSIGAGISTSPTAPQGSIAYYTFTEEFSDFSKAGALILPLTYTINVDAPMGQTNRLGSGGATNAAGTGNLKFSIKIVNVYYDQQIEDSTFKVS